MCKVLYYILYMYYLIFTISLQGRYYELYVIDEEMKGVYITYPRSYVDTCYRQVYNLVLLGTKSYGFLCTLHVARVLGTGTDMTSALNNFM